MSWLTEWKAISAQIQGLLEASRFYVDSLRDLFQIENAVDDFHLVGNRELLPHIKKIFSAVEKFRDAHRESIPTDAAQSLESMLKRRQQSYPNLLQANAYRHVHVMVTLLVSF